MESFQNNLIIKIMDWNTQVKLSIYYLILTNDKY